MMKQCLIVAATCIAMLPFYASAQRAKWIDESERQIPLAYDVDVVVVGGTTRGVAAAQAAAEQGATVFLLADRPYLGADMCATLRLWLEDGEVPKPGLGQAIFAKADPAASAGNPGLAYTYTASRKADPKHGESSKNPRLTDGRGRSAALESIQYNGDTTIIADLGKSIELDSIALQHYQRLGEFAVDSATVALSDDKKAWRSVETVKNEDVDKGGFESAPLSLDSKLEGRARYIRIELKQAAKAERMLLAEMIIRGKQKDAAAKVEKPVEYETVTTPMKVKRALDDALIAAKVDFLFGCYATDVLRDADGKLAGIVMANRSGRQAVRAKVLIDATDRGIAARLTAAEFADYPGGKQEFRRVVMGGAPGEGARTTGASFTVARRPNSTHLAHEYVLQLDMKDGSWASFAAADQEARNQTWQNGQVYGSEALFQVPPDAMTGRRQVATWTGADKLDLDALRPKGVDAVYVLGGCADVSREAAAKLMRPVAGIALGARVGTAAAAEAKTRSIGAALAVEGKKVDGALQAEIGEMLQGIRSLPGLDGKARSVKSPARSIPVIGRYDTVIVGGGTGGGPAGIGAARGGARTLIIEYLYGLGGVGTIGRISKYYHGNRVGFTAEIDKGVADMSEGRSTRNGWIIENKMEWMRSEFDKAGGDVWYLCLGAGSVVKGETFTGVVVATPHGRGVVLANTVIDSTGNAVIPACAGLKTQEIDSEHISVQGTGLPENTPGESYANSDWTFVDDDDVLDMWRIHVVGKHKFANAFDLGQLIDTRARRRIIGDHIVSPMDIINKRTYTDTITIAKSNFDNHGFSSHSLFMVTPPDKKGLTGKMPYRSMLPKGYDGILVTGLGMSAHGDAMPVMRMQADVQNQGYAAGKASAMAAEEGSTVRKVDIKKLQAHLVEMKIIPEAVMHEKDAVKIGPEKMKTVVQGIGKDYNGIAMLLTDPDGAKPALREAYKKTADAAEKLRYAHVLGMLHDDAGVDSLIKGVDATKWDKGWNFRGMGQFGATTSQVDNLVIALGRTKDKRALAAVTRKAEQLTEKSEFSHYRAVAIAFETIGDKSGAAVLAKLLELPGVSGHAFLEINDVIKRTPINRNDNSTRNNSLRELIVARALYRCGDHNGVGKKILRQYTQDYRGHYSRHAKAILSE
jgi:flavin-dependent dehydrogenase